MYLANVDPVPRHQMVLLDTEELKFKCVFDELY